MYNYPSWLVYLVCVKTVIVRRHLFVSVMMHIVICHAVWCRPDEPRARVNLRFIHAACKLLMSPLWKAVIVA